MGSHLQHFTHSDATRLTSRGLGNDLVTYKDDAHPSSSRVRPTRSAGVPASKLLLNGRWFPPPASRLRSPGSRTPVAPRPRPARRLLAGRGTGRLVARLILGAVRGIFPRQASLLDAHCHQPLVLRRAPVREQLAFLVPQPGCPPEILLVDGANLSTFFARGVNGICSDAGCCRGLRAPPPPGAGCPGRRPARSAFAATPSPSWISPSRLRVPGLSPARSCRAPRPASRPRRRARAGTRGRAPPARAPKGWRGLTAGSMQQGAPLGHEVEEFDGGSSMPSLAQSLTTPDARSAA